MTSSSDRGSATALSDPARIVVGTLLYTAKFDQLDDALVDRRARALIEEPLGELTTEEEYRAIEEALRSDARLTGLIALPDYGPEAHSEEEFRDFLRRLLARLDAVRPWSAPPHRELSNTRWNDYRNARLVGRVAMSGMNHNGRLNYAFSSVDGDPGRYVLILRLRSGDEVALVSPWWPESKHTAVLTNDKQRAAEDIMAALVEGTRIGADEIVPLMSNERHE